MPRQAADIGGPRKVHTNRNTALIHGYTQALRRRNLATNTIYRRKRILLSIGDAHDLAELSAEQIEVIVQGRRLVARSRNAFLVDLNGFYLWAVKVGALDRNPVDEMERSKVPRLLPRPITDRDLRHAIDRAGPKMRLWLVLAAYAGLRCCEISRLAAEDLVWHKKPPVIFVTGKGGHQRVIPMAEVIEQAFRSANLPRTGYLFRSQVGADHVTAQSMSQMIGRHLHDLDIQASAHMLRHYFGTLLYELTTDIRLTQEMLGHQSPQTTAGYTAWSTTKGANVVRTLGPRAS